MSFVNIFYNIKLFTQFYELFMRNAVDNSYMVDFLNFNTLCIPVLPFETNPPLIVNANSMSLFLLRSGNL
jgi:hypothetical protein